MSYFRSVLGIVSGFLFGFAFMVLAQSPVENISLSLIEDRDLSSRVSALMASTSLDQFDAVKVIESRDSLSQVTKRLDIIIRLLERINENTI